MTWMIWMVRFSTCALESLGLFSGALNIRMTARHRVRAGMLTYRCSSFFQRAQTAISALPKYRPSSQFLLRSPTCSDHHCTLRRR